MSDNYAMKQAKHVKYAADETYAPHPADVELMEAQEQIAELEAENKRFREALKRICLCKCTSFSGNCGVCVICVAKQALEGER